MILSNKIQPYLNFYIIRTMYLTYLNSKLSKNQSHGRYTLYYFKGWRLLGINCA